MPKWLHSHPYNDMLGDGLPEDERTWAFDFRVMTPTAWWRVPMQTVVGGLPTDSAAQYRIHKAMLQQFQYRRPRKHWVLKGFHGFRLEEFFAAYPDANLLWLHRDPVQVAASRTMMMADILEGIVGPVDLQAAAKMHLELTRVSVANTMTNPLVDDPRILHVRYTDFVADPVGTVGRYYDFCGRALSAASARRRCVTTWRTIPVTATASFTTRPSCSPTSARTSTRCTRSSGRSVSVSALRSKSGSRGDSVHDRLSVHSVTFLGTSVAEQQSHWAALGLTRLSLIDSQLAEPGLPQLVEQNGYSVDTVYHLFASGDGLSRVIDSAAEVGARVVYMLTGGRGEKTWDRAAEDFCAAVAPCVRHAEQAGVALAIENASALYADIHIAHTLRDTITLAEMAGVGICIDLFHCWAEAGLRRSSRTCHAATRTDPAERLCTG